MYGISKEATPTSVVLEQHAGASDEAQLFVLAHCDPFCLRKRFAGQWPCHAELPRPSAPPALHLYEANTFSRVLCTASGHSLCLRQRLAGAAVPRSAAEAARSTSFNLRLDKTILRASFGRVSRN